MIRFSLRQLEYFCAAAQAGSLSGAAERLGASGAAVAGAIDALEAHLDLRLFDRFPARGLRLTGPGAVFLETALALVSQAQQADRDMRAMAARSVGQIRWGCYAPFAALFAPPILHRHQTEWPGIRVDVRDDTFGPLAQALEAGALDILLSYDQGLDPLRHDVRLIATVQPRVVLPLAHPLAARPVLNVDDLVGLPFVAVTEPERGPGFLDALRAKGLEPPIALTCRSYELARSCVGKGMGFSLAAFQPPNPTSYHGDSVVGVPLVDLGMTWRVVAATRRGALSDPVLNRFADTCARIVVP